MKKNEKRVLIVVIIVFVMFSVIAFAVPFVKNGAFWLTYIFSAISFAVQPYVMKIAFKDGKNLNSKLYGFPIARISVVYGIAQFCSVFRRLDLLVRILCEMKLCVRIRNLSRTLNL